MHLPGWLWHNPLTWISGRFQWIGRYLAYLFEIFAAAVLLLMILAEALSLTTRFLIGPLSVTLFWEMFIVLPLCLAFILVALYLARDGLTRIMMWEADPNRQSLLSLQRERARLAYLRVRAQEENELLYYWKHRRAFDPSEPLPISKYAGISSFFYVTLSNYLGLPPESVIEPESGESALPPSPQAGPSGTPADQNPEEPVQVHSPYAVLLMGGVRFRLRGKEVPIGKFRARETLAFLAVPDHRKGLRRDDIVEAIHEEHALEKEDEEAPLGETDFRRKARDAYAYDVKALRELLKEACEKIGLPYVNPVEAEQGNNALHCLAEAYVTEDLTRLEQLEEYLAAHQQAGENTAGLEAFRKEYTATLSLYGDGFLGLQMRKQAASWAKAYFVRYQDLYHRLLWNLAEYEQALSQSQQGEERKTSLRQAVQLYEQCAFLTAPSRDDLEQGTYSPLSEQALRQCLSLYGLLGNRTNAHSTYHSYVKMLKRKSKQWSPDPQTVQVFEEVTRGSREA
jgi:hypothetical protein